MPLGKKGGLFVSTSKGVALRELLIIHMRNEPLSNLEVEGVALRHLLGSLLVLTQKTMLIIVQVNRGVRFHYTFT